MLVVLVIPIRMIDQEMSATALFSHQSAADHSNGYDCHVTGLNDFLSNRIMLVEIIDFIIDVFQPGQGILQQASGSSDAYIALHDSPDYLTIVADHHPFIFIEVLHDPPWWDHRKRDSFGIGRVIAALNATQVLPGESLKPDG
jgi:hypothetical protein